MKIHCLVGTRQFFIFFVAIVELFGKHVATYFEYLIVLDDAIVVL